MHTHTHTHTHTLHTNTDSARTCIGVKALPFLRESRLSGAHTHIPTHIRTRGLATDASTPRTRSNSFSHTHTPTPTHTDSMNMGTSPDECEKVEEIIKQHIHRD